MIKFWEFFFFWNLENFINFRLGKFENLQFGKFENFQIFNINQSRKESNF